MVAADRPGADQGAGEHELRIPVADLPGVAAGFRVPELAEDQDPVVAVEDLVAARLLGMGSHDDERLA
jgi:hypothetical protein